MRIAGIPLHTQSILTKAELDFLLLSQYEKYHTYTQGYYRVVSANSSPTLAWVSCHQLSKD